MQVIEKPWGKEEIIEINEKYNNTIFYIGSDGKLHFHDNFDNNHPYILDLRGEGRMINATLENLIEQLSGGDNDHLLPLNINFEFLNMLKPKTRTKFKYSATQNIANFPGAEDNKISEKYKVYGKILQREYNVLGYPDIKKEDFDWNVNEETHEFNDDNEALEKYKAFSEKWVSPAKKLENKINDITKSSSNINYFILLAINLNDRSTKSDITLLHSPKVLEQTVEDLKSIKFEDECATDCTVGEEFKTTALLSSLNYIRRLTFPYLDKAESLNEKNLIEKLNWINDHYLFTLAPPTALIPSIKAFPYPLPD